MKPIFPFCRDFKIPVSLFFIALAFLLPNRVCGQGTRQAAVEISATIGPDQDRVILRWTSDGQATGHFVYRKLQNSNDWGSVLKALPGSATTYTDSTLLPSLAYEYRVLRQGAGYEGYGYISSGIGVPHRAFQGKVMLLLDSTITVPLEEEISRLVQDLEGDGWEVIRLMAGRGESPQAVRNRLVATWTIDKLNTRCLFILGHVPVPYSGDMNPDGHPDHLGAWPADVYYGDMNGTWTDAAINNTIANDPRNDNVPGDGKFDQTQLPSDVEVQVGRVDFANMPAFAAPEIELLRAYLEKDHAYRHNLLEVSRRGIIDDNFGYFNGEAFAASAWKNFAPLVGVERVEADDYFTALTDSSALWSYGCGGGWYQGASGVGSTDQFAASSTKSVFTMLFGSYFGDWDVSNSFLRAPLAQGLTLTNAWSGRPHWQVHRMGMGETIGHCTRMTQNNAGTLYYPSYGARFVHIALMGDPTLRHPMVTPVPVVVAEPAGYGVRISWSPSPAAEDGYLVYMRPAGTSAYVLLTDEPVEDTSYTLACLEATGCYEVMVRARALVSTSSGSYYNLSQGVTGIFCQPLASDVIAEASYVINESTVTFTNLSLNADRYSWAFGDGSTSLEENPAHTYLDGDFTATLIAANACKADTTFFDFTVFTAAEVPDAPGGLRVFPNPAQDIVWIEGGLSKGRAELYGLDGRRITDVQILGMRTPLSIAGLPPGLYLLVIRGTPDRRGIRLVKE